MFSDSDYATDKDTRKSVSSLVAIFGVTLLTRSSKDHRAVTLISTYIDYVELLACSQEVKFFNIILEK